MVTAVSDTEGRMVFTELASDSAKSVIFYGIVTVVIISMSTVAANGGCRRTPETEPPV